LTETGHRLGRKMLHVEGRMAVGQTLRFDHCPSKKVEKEVTQGLEAKI
jgi:hypothetical protein